MLVFKCYAVLSEQLTVSAVEPVSVMLFNSGIPQIEEPKTQVPPSLGPLCPYRAPEALKKGPMSPYIMGPKELRAHSSIWGAVAPIPSLVGLPCGALWPLLDVSSSSSDSESGLRSGLTRS